MSELQSLEEANERLKARLKLYETDATTRGFYALNKIVNQQIDLLNDFNLKTEISADPKTDKRYDRVEGIWTKMKSMLLDLKSLKSELGLSGDEKRDTAKRPFIDTIASAR